MNSPDLEDRIGIVIERHPHTGREHLIPTLQELQESLGFLSTEAVIRVAAHFRLPASKVYGVATFYGQFRFRAPGRHRVQVCRGTACHVHRSQAVLDAVRQRLGIEPGETTGDGAFTLEAPDCIGACGLAPVLAVDGTYHGGVTPEAVADILRACREGEAIDACV